MNSENENSIHTNNNTIEVNFNSTKKQIFIGNSYENFVKDFQKKFNINNNDIQNIIFYIEDIKIKTKFDNEKLYYEIFGINGSLKNYFKNSVCTAVLNKQDIETKCIFLEEEIRNNKKGLQLLYKEIEFLEKKKKIIKDCNEKKKKFDENEEYKISTRKEKKEFKESYKNENEKKETSQKEKEKRNKIPTNENVVIEKMSYVQSTQPIIHTVKIKKKKNENWPNDLKLICVPNDSDIYFKHVDLNLSNEIPTMNKKGEYIYEKQIEILFKNYRKIKKTEYFLRAELLSDNHKFKIDLGNIIVKVV